ncbi:CAP domain-containing protein [Paraburkholderia sp. MM6662-R1]|uniref:CAP domain-containing protein n=1 Tax=Paraburkholderia sp. MM6662-R1 TaxID=2991066 RepID=UPI003D263C2A
MTIKSTFALTSAAVAASILVAACGGGGGGGSSSTGAATPASAPGSASSPSSASSPVTGTQPTPQYAANSATLAMFNQVNAYRQQCGFPAVQQNTILDQAAQAHAMWEGLNNTVADNETAGQQGFTGVSYVDRDVHFGFPSAVAYTGGVSANYYTTSALSETQYGQTLVNEWISTVYHSQILLTPVTKMGVGEYETALNGFPVAWGSLTLADTSMAATHHKRTHDVSVSRHDRRSVQGRFGIAYAAEYIGSVGHAGCCHRQRDRYDCADFGHDDRPVRQRHQPATALFGQRSEQDHAAVCSGGLSGYSFDGEYDIQRFGHWHGQRHGFFA